MNTIKTGVYLLKYRWMKDAAEPSKIEVINVTDNRVITKDGQWDKEQFQIFLREGVLKYDDHEARNT